MLVSETKNQTTTNQLIQEQKHIEKFENVICPKYGLKCIKIGVVVAKIKNITAMQTEL